VGESPRADPPRLWESSSWCGRLTERSAGVRGCGLPRGYALRGLPNARPGVAPAPFVVTAGARSRSEFYLAWSRAKPVADDER